MENEIQADKILRRAEVIERVGLSYSTIFNMIKAGTFPKPRRVGKHAIGWLESEITAWIRNLPEADPKDCHSPKRNPE